MVELACAVDARFEASRLEEDTKRSYSIDTIEKLRAQLPPGDELYFLIGADAFAEIRTWHRWEEVLELTEFIVVPRPGREYSVPEGARVTRLDNLELPVSSSDIRARLAAGEETPEVPAEVREYIQRRGLYGRNQQEVPTVSP